MKYVLLTLTVFTSALLHAQTNSGNQRTVPASASKETIAAHLEAQFKAMTVVFLKDDMAATAAFYADDAMIVSGRFEIRGREAIDKYWASLKGRGRDWKLTTNSIEVYDGVALHDGVSVLTSMNGDKEIVSRSRFLVVWVRQKDGSWKISKDYYAIF
jgi:ketosteroid isomerase-like protein